MIFDALALAAALAASVTDQEQVVGNYYACEVKLELPGGRLTATRSLQENTKALYASDQAHWEPKDYSSGYIKWDASPGQNEIRLSNIPAVYEIYIRTERRLPKVSAWELRRPDRPAYDGFGITMSTGADRRLGHAAMPLRVVLSFAASQDRLDWTVMDVLTSQNVFVVNMLMAPSA